MPGRGEEVVFEGVAATTFLGVGADCTLAAGAVAMFYAFAGIYEDAYHSEVYGRQLRSRTRQDLQYRRDSSGKPAFVDDPGVLKMGGTWRRCGVSSTL